MAPFRPVFLVQHRHHRLEVDCNLAAHRMNGWLVATAAARGIVLPIAVVGGFF